MGCVNKVAHARSKIKQRNHWQRGVEVVHNNVHRYLHVNKAWFCGKLTFV
jgi:hypothetical protein